MKLENGISSKLEVSREVVKLKGFKISWSKTEYMKCRFSNMSKEDDVTTNIESSKVPKRNHFCYLGSTGHKEGDNRGGH